MNEQVKKATSRMRQIIFDLESFMSIKGKVQTIRSIEGRIQHLERFKIAEGDNIPALFLKESEKELQHYQKIHDQRTG